MPFSVEIRASGPGFAIGVWRNLIVVAFSTTPSEEAASRMASISTELAQEHESLGMLHVIHTDRGAPPGAAARQHYITMLRTLNDRLIAGAVIASGQGFLSSIVRSIIAGFSIAVRPRFPLKVFATPEQSSTWLAEQMAMPEPEIFAAIVLTREAIGEI